MKTIIVPTDFTAASSNAVQFAVDMALQIKATIFLLHAYQLPVAIAEPPAITLTIDEIKKASEQRLTELKEEISKQINYKVNVIADARPGNIIDELAIACKKMHPFAVVMGSCRSGKLERMLFGSAALSAIHHLETPVLMIPPYAKFKPVKRIGLAYDFGHYVPISHQQEIRSVIEAFNAELHVLNVDHNHPRKQESKRHTFLLHRTIADLNPEYHFIDRENIEVGLNELADQYHIDFMIMIPRKHKLLEMLFRKSHADQMALHTHMPLMAIHQ